jgi:hypothetical protein
VLPDQVIPKLMHAKMACRFVTEISKLTLDAISEIEYALASSLVVTGVS